MGINHDADFMHAALLEAQTAASRGEVPVGAVLVHNTEIIGRGHNQTIGLHDPSAHAEILALRAAGQVLQNYRQLGTTLYVTLEPCLMCFTALVHARVERVVFGAFDPKTGSCGSRFAAQSLAFLNHHFAITGGILQAECAQILQDFFSQRRLARQTHFL